MNKLIFPFFLIIAVALSSTCFADREKVFNYPMIKGYRLDVCLRWAQSCGKPAADAFCANNGFQEAATFKLDNDIGARSPTMTLSSGQICAKSFCDGFRSITCRARAQEKVQPAMVFENCQVSPCVIGVADPGYAVLGNQRYAEGWRRFNTNPYPLLDFPNPREAWRFACRIHYSSPRHRSPDIENGRINCAAICGGNPRCP